MLPYANRTFAGNGRTGGSNNAKLSPELCGGRDVFLYRRPAGAETGLAGGGN